MKRINAILVVVFVVGTVAVLAAQEPQAMAPSNVVPAVATTANAAGVTAEPGAASAEMMPPHDAGKSPEQARTDSENNSVPEGIPEASQNFIEYGGPG